jgi:2-polyprenyl-3-methyl-5-hydroxy-6-metoxy-1,4-benzoquinol methylase
MTYQQFHDAYVDHFKQRFSISVLENLSPKLQGNLNFALSTNTRAKTFLDTLSTQRSIAWPRTTFLDVGCAYGGGAIEAATRGARAYGVDIEAQYVRLAEINARDRNLPVEFHCCSMTDRRVQSLLPKAAFNVIVLNDVFEHVYDTTGLLQNLAYLAAPGCLLYFAIPNGFELGFVQSEGHTKGFGSSIVNPFYWRLSPERGLNIFYRRWEYYEALFRGFGFEHIGLINRPKQARVNGPQVREKVGALEAELGKRIASGKDKPFYQVVETELLALKGELFSDLEHLDANAFHWKYHTQFWTGIAEYRGASLWSDSLRRELPKELGRAARKLSKLTRSPRAFVRDSLFARLWKDRRRDH